VQAGTPVRPTPDRVRETLFNWLADHVRGARCLDLFAGSGALGLEALSRGASDVVFVERDRELADAITSVLDRLNAAGQVVCGASEAFLSGVSESTFDLVFMDPPYDLPLAALMDAVVEVIRPGSLVYVERRKADGLPTVPWGSWHRDSRAGSIVYGLAIADARAA
jgi:16S rRNA (guanine966-N2)-methyltransferase